MNCCCRLALWYSGPLIFSPGSVHQVEEKKKKLMKEEDKEENEKKRSEEGGSGKRRGLRERSQRWRRWGVGGHAVVSRSYLKKL